MERPNILFILTDQQRKDTLSVYGDLQCETPNLDQLSQEGHVFENAYATCPICTPARASLQTGLYPMHHGMITNSYNYGNMIQELVDTPELLSRQLEKAGYQIGYTGKWHLGTGVENVKNDDYIQYYMKDIHFAELTLGNDSVPTTVGYTGDDFPGHGFGGHRYEQFQQYLKERGLENKIEHIQTGFYNGHQAGVVTSGVETTIESFLVDRTKTILSEFKEQNEPWYFQLNFWGPHEPYFVPQEFLDKYENVSLKPWENLVDESPLKPRIHDVKRGSMTEWQDLEPIVKHYFAGVSHIDYQIGQLIAYLKEQDLYHNTVIIFSSDHGESLGIHNGLFDKALFMYEETCSIPLIIKETQPQQSGMIKEFANSCDIYSTILDYAGVSKEKYERDGKSLKSLIDKTAIDWPDTVVTECSGVGSVLFSQRMIRKGPWKYVFNCGDTDELYHLEDDPYELENLIQTESYQEQVKLMRAELHHWMSEHRDNLIFEFEKYL
ncbi:sulfatase-like hydrolase/transferase [Vagococcus zengguangii]|uniref:Sulfatase N-terminal domain-containing protein n=1 Tax=Vagococcus zengguangii TaxID=2571750 RepID=A0A4D7CVC2_9ENTE|nr:sulfatase-like hydrolase/transferase [Vagococcus zengguangii]QCI86200.1 hypothetical protein FA707_04135 [Vagococcus zengguangii]